jgi:CO/xanthine dehydrogenase FAD-binding subunit
VDLNTVETLRSARRREDLVLATGETYLAGGSWLFSEPQLCVTGLVDLQSMGWESWTVTAGGLSIAATCTIAELVAGAAAEDWAAAGLFRDCADAFLMSSKIWTTATVGGNLCLALPAGAMISLLAGLGWTADGGERREPVSRFITGPGTTTLTTGEVLRSIEVPLSSLVAPARVRTFALTQLGRSSSVVLARLTESRTVLVVTAATPRPRVLELTSEPSIEEITAAVTAIEDWYDDAHGAPDWRAAITVKLALEVCGELRA